MSRTRLDEELVRRGIYPTRARARDAVLRGTVEVNGVVAAKPAQGIAASDKIAIDDAAQPYVSRAALKLKHALKQFHIEARGKRCLDLGSSTGGFTQVLLEQGAAHVTAIDVGHGQMHASLVGDPRVTLHEGLNARDIQLDHIGRPIEIIVCDVSFISLLLALPPALAMMEPGSTLVALIKPQFEVGKGRNPHDEAQQRDVCERVQTFLSSMGWKVLGVTPSPVRGGDGTQEFLVAASKTKPANQAGSHTP